MTHPSAITNRWPGLIPHLPATHGAGRPSVYGLAWRVNPALKRASHSAVRSPVLPEATPMAPALAGPPPTFSATAPGACPAKRNPLLGQDPSSLLPSLEPSHVISLPLPSASRSQEPLLPGQRPEGAGGPIKWHLACKALAGKPGVPTCLGMFAAWQDRVTQFPQQGR